MSSERLQDLDNGTADALWDRMRAEERTEQLKHVAQDAARDAKLAAIIDTTNSLR